MKAVLLLLLVFHLAYAATVAGGASLALVFDLFAGREQDARFRRLADALLRHTLLTRGTGILGVGSLALILYVLPAAYPGVAVPAWLATGMLLMLSAGLALLFTGRTLRSRTGVTGLSLLLGAGGVAALTLVYFALLCSAVLLTAPERWPLLVATPSLVLSWSAVGRFLAFSTLGLVLVGAGLLISAERIAEESYRHLVRRWGQSLVVVFLLAWPLWLLLDLVNLPLLANSTGGFYLAGAMVAAAALSVLAARPFPGATPPGSRGIMVLGLGLLLLFAVQGHLQRESALTVHALAAVPNAQGAPDAAAKSDAPAKEEPAATEEPAASQARETAAPSGEAESVVAGKELFERICAGCHAFDRRVVGPPLNAVVPAYRDRREALEAFLRDPVKKNPDYPAMPDPGLDKDQVAAVAAYLLQAVNP